MSSYQSDSPIKNPISAMRDGEVTVFAIKRHPIGLIGYYASFVALLVIVGVIAVAAPSLLGDSVDSDTVQKGAMIAFAVALAFSLVYGIIGHYVYNSNSWILTTDSLTQVLQRSLFDRQSSQLSLANLEDVTVRQDGILAHMLNYGTLNAETAGERSKFIFIYCPRPNEIAQKILVARENFEQGQWYADQRTDHRADAAPAPQVPPTQPTPPTA
jgi:hypothetical protein